MFYDVGLGNTQTFDDTHLVPCSHNVTISAQITFT
jgi:hypothetical protein